MKVKKLLKHFTSTYFVGFYKKGEWLGNYRISEVPDYYLDADIKRCWLGVVHSDATKFGEYTITDGKLNITLEEKKNDQ